MCPSSFKNKRENKLIKNDDSFEISVTAGVAGLSLKYEMEQDYIYDSYYAGGGFINVDKRVGT